MGKKEEDGALDLPGEQAMNLILSGVKSIGWICAVPGMVDEDSEVPGMIIGTKKYVDDVLEGKYSKDE